MILKNGASGLWKAGTISKNISAGRPAKGYWHKYMEMENNKSRQETVAAITVTYNRTRTLEKCIDALLNQTRPVDHIIIADNHSCEEEQEKIRKIAAKSHKIKLLFLDENRGGAGGFEAGMREAKKLAPDWYWLMDDDAYPRKDCLETLLDTGKELPDAGGLCPLIYGIDLKHYQLFHHKKLSRFMMKNSPVVRDADQLKAVTEEDANAFVGPLFPGKVVDELGIADGSLFIYGDDSEYTRRVSGKHKLYLIRDAVIDHQDAPVLDANMTPAGWWKEYYCNRNQYFMIREFQENKLVRWFSFGLLTARLMAIIVKSKLKGYHRLRSQLIIKAVKDGLGNKRGKVIDPQKYFAYLKEHGLE